MEPFPRKPPRWWDDNSTYFLTVCTFHRRKFLHQKSVPEFLVEELRFYSKRIEEMIAYTIMPNHLHLIINIKTVKSMSAFLRDFKKYTSHKLAKYSMDGHVWQCGTMDHCIRTSLQNNDYENHLKYIFFNSWKHLGIKPKEFPYHNFYDIVERGWLEDDFFDFDTPKEFANYE
jgi:putative transposase